MKYILTLAFFILSAAYVQAQVEIVDKPEGLDDLVSSRTAQRKHPDAKMDGYRILIVFDDSRSRAESVRNKFIAEFGQKYDADIVWEEPNFKVYAGIFKTKLEAQELLNMVKDKYPTAILVKDKVKYPKL